MGAGSAPGCAADPAPRATPHLRRGENRSSFHRPRGEPLGVRESTCPLTARISVSLDNRIVPAQPAAEPSAADGSASTPSCGHRLRWATLLARVFSSDFSECAACGGRLRIIAALTDPASIRIYLEGVGLPAMPPPRALPEPLFEFAA